MPLKPHPTNPDKMVYVNAEYNLPKPWVGLTDEDYINLLVQAAQPMKTAPEMAVAFGHLVEAKLMEKNNAT